MKGRLWRAFALGICLLLLAGITAPHIGADRFGTSIREGLERGLGRKVEIGKVRFNLFTGPGFTISDVIIHDEPSVGIEPFAHMLELDARVRLTALLSGRIEFARLRFIEPSVNIVKPESAPWNISPLLERTVAASASRPAAAAPEIQVSDGRIFFKFGDTKSSFYFLNADVTIAPRSSESGAFLVRFSGEPASTNRAALGSGEFSASGRLITNPRGPARLELDLDLEDGDVDDLVTLIRGDSLGVHGKIGSSAKLWGPVNGLQILGTMNVEDVHRWDLSPHRTGKYPIRYRGTLDLSSELLVFQTRSADNPRLALDAKVTIAEALSRPRWSAELSAAKLPAPVLVDTARRLGVPFPKEMAIDGNVAGVIGYVRETGLQGQFVIDAAKVKLAGSSDLVVGKAQILITGDEVRLTPATLSGSGRSAELAAVYRPDTHAFEATIRGEALRIVELKKAGIIPSDATPLINQLSGGTWSGWVRYSSAPGAEDRWDALLTVHNTISRIPGFLEPVRIETAQVELDGIDVTMRRMRLSSGGVEAFGTYAYKAEGDKHLFHLAIPQASVADVERLFRPAVQSSSSRGLLARTLNWTRGASPDWIRARHAEGSIRIASLSAGDADIRRLRTRIVWNGSIIRLEKLEAKAFDGNIEGAGALELTGGAPRYRFTGKLTNATWRGGKLDLSGSVDTAGSGVEMLLNLRSAGKFNARSLELDPDYPMRTLTGEFGFGFSKTGPQLTLTAVQASVGTERFSGQGATQSDGRLQMELASASRIMHVFGPVAPLRLEVTTDKAPVQPR